jgi:hypothetical protein
MIKGKRMILEHGRRIDQTGKGENRANAAERGNSLRAMPYVQEILSSTQQLLWRSYYSAQEDKTDSDRID